MPDCDSTHCNHNHHHHPSQLKNSSSVGGLVPSSKEHVGLVSSLSSSSSRSIVESSCSCSSSVAVVGGAVDQEGGGDRACSLLSFPESCQRCFRKMLSCRVLIVVLLVKCLVLSFIIPAHLIPTTSSEYPPPPDYSIDNEISGSNGEAPDSNQMMPTGDDDGFENNNMMDDQPLSFSLKSKIMNLVERFDIPSQPVTPSETNGGDDHAAPSSSGSEDGTDAAAGDGDKNDGDADGDGDGKDDSTTDPAPETPEQTADSDTDGDTNTESGGETAAGGDNGETESQVEDGVKAGDSTHTESEPDKGEAADASSEKSSSEGKNGACSASGGHSGDSDAAMKTVLEKIDGLMDAVKNIDLSIDKMETLVQSTMIDERVYKCVSAISNGNQTQAIKYWKQILRYLSTPQKQASILNQLIRDSYGGSQEHILPVIQFIDQTTQYYGYYTLFKELSKYDHLYQNTAVFTLGHYVKKSCGRDSALYKSLPGAVQSVFAEYFTLQNKHNKGYLYYAKRCVAKHYFYCLDVLTKRIDPYVLDGLAEDSEEKKRYHWRLNATDATITKFFLLNHDKYWYYRLQDLNNSPRFKMEEAGSNAEVELAHFQLKLHTDDEIMIQVRDSEDYLEEEDYKADKSEVRLHSFHKAEGIPDSPRMFWLANSVAGGDDEVDEPASCNVEMASVSSSNGNGNGSSK